MAIAIFTIINKMKPKIGKKYYFVRVHNKNIENASFIRYEDDSALVIKNNFAHIFENEPLAWQDALCELAEMGFVEISKARQQGIIPQD